jgi:hypothetical protein
MANLRVMMRDVAFASDLVRTGAPQPAGQQLIRLSETHKASAKKAHASSCMAASKVCPPEAKDPR